MTDDTILLSVLGEGNFRELLTFIENHAPDEVTDAREAQTQ